MMTGWLGNGSRSKLRRLGAALAVGLAAVFGLRVGAGQERPPVVEVIDGDTLLIDGEPVQLAGIDAPELGQLCMQEAKTWPCGLEAARALTMLLALGRPVCEIDSEAKPLPTALCRSGDGDLAETLLRRGYAVALPDAFPNYKEGQAAAQKVPLGIWRGAFVAPPVWREGARLARESETPEKSCLLKGIVEENGRKIILVPADRVYASVELRPERGERSFCSDEDARLAGWVRRPERGR